MRARLLAKNEPSYDGRWIGTVMSIDMHTLCPAKPSQSVRIFFPDYGRRGVEKIELRVKGKMPALKSILLKIL